MTECKKCGKPTLWFKHKDTKKPMMVDAEPHAKGTFRVHGEYYKIVKGAELQQCRDNKEPLYLN